MQRPERIRIKNESAQLQSLPEGERYFQDLGGEGEILFLGLGPNPALAAELFPQAKILYYMECTELSTQLPEGYTTPAQFKQISADEAGDLSGFRIILYTPGKRLFPSFWEPRLSKLSVARAGIRRKKRSKTVWIPGDENSLLLPELCRAFKAEGFSYRVIEPDAMRKDLLNLLSSDLPELVLSVNFNGLDNAGETFFMLREAGVKIIVWMVDNPFHIISGIKSNYWQEVPLLVTDHWFIPALEKHGAKKVRHLPLATDPAIFNAKLSPYPQLGERTVFVGRSSFPAKDNFFSGCSFNIEDEKAALQAIENNIKPNFEWWAAKDGLDKFWPGREVRATGFRAEQSGLIWRILSLQNAGNKLTVFGDEGWTQYLPDADLRPPVDYFTALPSIYAGAGISLNMTSPLLPCGLTQRNFDVWTTGGFLLSDYTPGLSIFPEDLLQYCTFKTPEQIPEKTDFIKSHPQLKKELSKNWQELTTAKHTYKNRIHNILNFID
ncbi:glycosyltransferase [Desulfovibrio sp. JC022]|uniref:glycosyltransferase family protein n=1 Tax=Desulfovibrio sp. JC022 TaxID=2593642 RepID=UPI0013D36ECD|nr:glycosyltransferase [Desulfovibrio sp. JC022]NDV22589.1 glycosyltransferase [Desulfovibrio sp. JC022]